MTGPDFDELRRVRDAEIAKIVREAARQLWGDEAAEKAYAAHISYGGGSHGCYCACSDGGPCEHDFSGWRDFEDGNGGEQFCQRCGTGAMSHSMWTAWE